MSNRHFEAIRHATRAELEAFVLQAAMRHGRNRQEIASGNQFTAMLIGFLLGVLVAVSGLLLGCGLA